MPSSYSPLCCGPDLVKEKCNSVHSLKGHDASVNLNCGNTVQMKLRCDHRSCNRNLNDCKFYPTVWVSIAKLVEHCSARPWVRIPLKPWKSFRAKICNCLNCDYNCDDHISIFICIPAVQIYFIPVTGKDELDKLVCSQPYGSSFLLLKGWT